MTVLDRSLMHFESFETGIDGVGSTSGGLLTVTLEASPVDTNHVMMYTKSHDSNGYSPYISSLSGTTLIIGWKKPRYNLMAISTTPTNLPIGVTAQSTIQNTDTNA